MGVDGKKIKVEITLKIVCVCAICAAGLSVKFTIQSTNGITCINTIKMSVPIILNARWIIVVRFALRLALSAASIAVIQVPIFCPKII